MGVKIFRVVAITGMISAGLIWFGSEFAIAQAGSTPDAAAATPGQQQGQPGRGRGMGMGGFPGGGRGVLGTVTEATAEHYTIKTDSGDVYTVHFSANTRIMKQGPGRGPGQGQGQGQAGGTGSDSGAGSGAGQGGGRRRGGGDGGEDGGNRPAPQTIKPTDIHVGDIITAGGEMDAATKSVGAIFIALVDPERAKQMREMQANYGRTWLAGRVTAIHETTITIDGTVDHTPHAIVVDENTSFRQRRDAITLADIQPGEQLRAEGAIKGGAFLATTVTTMQPQNRDGGPGPGQGSGSGPGQAPGAGAGPQ
jgi:hypothetical protein